VKLPIRLTVTVLLNTASACGPFLPTVFSAGAMPAQLTSPTARCAARGVELQGAFDGMSRQRQQPLLPRIAEHQRACRQRIAKKLLRNFGGVECVKGLVAATRCTRLRISVVGRVASAIERFESEIALAPEVMSCFLMTGDSDYNLRVVVKDLDAYHQFLRRSLTRIPGVAHIKSSFALKAVLMRTAPPL
jgi:DNA-binding Lrp family transcriptional regulator